MLAQHQIINKTNQGNKRAFVLNKRPKMEKITAISQEKIYIDTETGERIPAQTIIKNIDRQGFEITYLAYFYELFDLLGNKKMKVFSYLLENKNSANELMITTRELAERTKVSLKTAHDTLTLLEDRGLIKRRTGGLMIVPKIAHKGDFNREKNLMLKFKEFDAEKLPGF